MSFDKAETAVVFTDLQVAVLSRKGKNWDAIGASVAESKIVENMLRIFKTAKAAAFPVFCFTSLFLSYRSTMEIQRSPGIG